MLHLIYIRGCDPLVKGLCNNFFYVDIWTRHLYRFSRSNVHNNLSNSVTINLTKAEIENNSSGSDFNKWLRNTLLLTFITSIQLWLCIDGDQQNIYNDYYDYNIIY